MVSFIEYLRIYVVLSVLGNFRENLRVCVFAVWSHYSITLRNSSQFCVYVKRRERNVASERQIVLL
jgi:hypothetical protein